MIKRSSIVRKSKPHEIDCWLCNEFSICYHFDKSVEGYLCKNCWQDALEIDRMLSDPKLGLSHPSPNDPPPNNRF